MSEVFKNKSEAVESIIMSLEDSASFRDIEERFERLTKFSITRERIRQTVDKLKEEGKIRVKKKKLEESEIRENGRGGRRKNTKITLIQPKETQARETNL